MILLLLDFQSRYRQYTKGRLRLWLYRPNKSIKPRFNATANSVQALIRRLVPAKEEDMKLRRERI